MYLKMKLMILLTLLAQIFAQVAPLDNVEQFEDIDNNLVARPEAYETALPYENERYERDPNRNLRDPRSKFRDQYKSKLKKAKSRATKSKLKFRNYKQKKSDRLQPMYYPDKKLRNSQLMQNQFDDAEVSAQLERRNRAVDKSKQQKLNKLGDEPSNEQIEGESNDGFTFKNLMPFWRPFETLRKTNRPPSTRADGNQNEKSISVKNLDLLKENFLLLPEQSKVLLIKALERNKKVKPDDHFDNLAQDGIKVIKIGGKSDLKLEMDDDDDVDKKKLIGSTDSCDRKGVKTAGAGKGAEEKHDEATTTSTEKPQQSKAMPGCLKKPEHGKHEEHKGHGGHEHSDGQGGHGKQGGHESQDKHEDHKEDQDEQEKPEDAQDGDKDREDPTCVSITTPKTSTADKSVTTSRPTDVAVTDCTDISSSEEATVSSQETDDIENDLKEEILSCTADKLEKYLKSLKSKCGGGTEQQPNPYKKLPERKLQTVHDSIVPITTQNDAILENMLKHLTKADLLRLNITINGLVMTDEKPSQISGNATINLLPAKQQADRMRRGLFSSRKRKDKAKEEECTEDSKKQCDDEKPVGEGQDDGCKKKCKTEQATPVPDTDLSKDAMSSFQISNEIIKMVSQMVHSNPKMKTLWPSLKHQKPGDQKKTAASIRKLCKGPARKRLDDMIRRAMSSVDEIIDQEVQQRSCAPLSEDLQNFYELILSLHAKQAKRTEEREERLNKSENLEDIGGSSTCAPDSKDSCGGKHDADDAELNENSLFDMIHERKLEYDQEMSEIRHSREAIRRNRDLAADTANSALVRRLREGYSPAFLKLHEVADAIDRAAIGAEVP